MHDCYKPLQLPEDVKLSACPVCGAKAELWRYSETNDSPTSTAVTCSNGEEFLPQDGLANEGCLLYMPPENFYRATIREAMKYWEAYVKALEEQRVRHLKG